VLRFFDIVFSLVGVILFSPIFLILLLACLFETGSPVFVQKRVGVLERRFYLIKFRTMYVNTESIPTHMVDSNSITRLGSYIRKTKLDELLQLFNVLAGDMSLVGPRPCLETQKQLILARRKLGVFSVKPGITGIAQLTGVDMSKPEYLAKVDSKMIENYGINSYFKYIFMTIFKLTKQTTYINRN
jgi:O-antigen biosynthesis protein WbqP